METASSLVAQYARKMAERQRWEADNPLLAAAWNDALLEDHERTVRAEVEEARRRLETVHVPEQLRGMGVPDSAVDAMPKAEDTGPWNAAGKFLDSDAQFLVLLGTVGSGKTVAAARVLKWALLKGKDASFVRATTLARLSGYDDKQAFDELCWCPVVVLDDLGTEHLHGFAQSLFNEWLDCRYAKAAHRTVITANLTRAEFEARVGERAMDRMRQCGQLHVTTDKSLRRRP